MGRDVKCLPPRVPFLEFVRIANEPSVCDMATSEVGRIAFEGISPARNLRMSLWLLQTILEIQSSCGKINFFVGQ